MTCMTAKAMKNPTRIPKLRQRWPLEYCDVKRGVRLTGRLAVPHAGVSHLETSLYVCDTRNRVGPSGCTGKSTHLIVILNGSRVASQGSDVVRCNVRSVALQFYAHKLVDHERFKSVGERVDVIDPEQPSLHGEHWNHVTSVDHHEGDEDGRQPCGDVVALRTMSPS
jgi:hypothetical protein